MFSAAVDSNRSAPRPAQSPTLSPTRSATTRRVARVVLGDARLDLADEVGADVGGLGVDAAAELGEERHEAGAEAEADDQEGRLGDGESPMNAAEGGEDAAHAEQAERDHQEAGDGAAAHGDLHRARRGCAAPPRRCAGSSCTLMYMPMMPDAIEQAAPTRKAMPVMMPSRGRRWSVRRRPRASRRALMTRPMTTAPTDGQQADGRYWRRMKATAPSKIVPRDVLHRRGAGVARQDVPGEVEGESDRRRAGDRDHPRMGWSSMRSSECGRRPREAGAMTAGIDAHETPAGGPGHVARQRRRADSSTSRRRSVRAASAGASPRSPGGPRGRSSSSMRTMRPAPLVPARSRTTTDGRLARREGRGADALDVDGEWPDRRPPMVGSR